MIFRNQLNKWIRKIMIFRNQLNKWIRKIRMLHNRLNKYEVFKEIYVLCCHVGYNVRLFR